MAHFFSGGFPGFGGFGGMDGDDGMDEEPKDVDTNKLYETLGVEKNATKSEIKKAYHKQAKIHHPDRGGDAEKFKEVQAAYEVLSNDDKREVYDKYGLDGLKDGPGGMGGAHDIFEMFGMGGGRRKQQSQGAKKTKAMGKEIEVKLDEIYNGKVVKLPFKRRVCCEVCEGKGGKNIKTCTDCKGQGYKIKTQMIGPGMMTQSQVPCNICRTEGKIYDKKDICKACNGEKIKDNEKILEVPVEKGIPDGKDILFAGEGNEMPGAMAGDLHVIIKTKKHPIFERKGADLFMNKKISLLEALCGVNFKIKHLDGTDVVVCSAPSDVICSGEMKVIQGKGMPFYQDSMSYGNLFIKFDVEFPKPGSLKPDAVENLKKVLPGPKIQPPPKNYEMLEDYYEGMKNENPEGGRHRKNSEEEDGHPHNGQRVECGSQ